MDIWNRGYLYSSTKCYSDGTVWALIYIVIMQKVREDGEIALPSYQLWTSLAEIPMHEP